MVGKTHLAAQTAINFLRNAYFDKSGNPKKVIYVNVNIKEAKSIFKDFEEAGIIYYSKLCIVIIFRLP